MAFNFAKSNNGNVKIKSSNPRMVPYLFDQHLKSKHNVVSWFPQGSVEWSISDVARTGVVLQLETCTSGAGWLYGQRRLPCHAPRGTNTSALPRSPLPNSPRRQHLPTVEPVRHIWEALDKLIWHQNSSKCDKKAAWEGRQHNALLHWTSTLWLCSSNIQCAAQLCRIMSGRSIWWDLDLPNWSKRWTSVPGQILERYSVRFCGQISTFTQNSLICLFQNCKLNSPNQRMHCVPDRQVEDLKGCMLQRAHLVVAGVALLIFT